jgi:transcriptional regulator with XRE-family HTH domain
MIYRVDNQAISRLRNDNHLSKEKLAMVLKICREQYSKKESGIAPFKGDEIGLLAGFYNVDPGFFYTPSVRNLQTELS